jgi:hypothetical protein
MLLGVEEISFEELRSRAILLEMNAAQLSMLAEQIVAQGSTHFSGIYIKLSDHQAKFFEYSELLIKIHRRMELTSITATVLHRTPVGSACY